MNTTNVYDKIIERLQQSVDRPSIYKFFDYSIEELQDNPDRLKEIADYLTLHDGKYDDFEISTWIDAKNFRPVFMIKLFPSEEYSKHMTDSRLRKVIDYFQTQKEK